MPCSRNIRSWLLPNKLLQTLAITDKFEILLIPLWDITLQSLNGFVRRGDLCTRSTSFSGGSFDLHKCETNISKYSKM